MKDGTTRLACKAEHAIDLHTGAMLGVSIFPADQGDTAGLTKTLDTVAENLGTLGDDAPELLCVVTDKGRHQAKLIKEINLSHNIERSFALRKRTGAMANVTVRLLENVTKRYLIHAAAYNLGVLMRALFRTGAPRRRAIGENDSLFGVVIFVVVRRGLGLTRVMRPSSYVFPSSVANICLAASLRLSGFFRRTDMSIFWGWIEKAPA